jgi:hypothetical protein
MLGIIEAAMIPIPLVFYRYGHRIRQKSVLIRSMREDQEKLDTKKRKAVERQERLELKDVGVAGEKDVENKEFEV